MEMRMLELFSGTGSVGRELQKFCPTLEIVSLDIHPKYRPTHAIDVIVWDYSSMYPPYHFDIIWASPPCTEYSKAKTMGVRDLKYADKIVKRTIDIIRFYRPKYWFIENPGGGGMLEKRSFMKPFEPFKNACTYCHYGTPFMKPTNIWTNVTRLNLRYCSKADPCSQKKRRNKHKQTAQHSTWSQYSKENAVPGSVTAKKVYPIPSKLIRHLFSTIF